MTEQLCERSLTVQRAECLKRVGSGRPRRAELGHELPSGLPIRKAVFHDKAALRPSQNKRLDSSQTRLRQSQYLAQ
jgi:hypothetical protein